MALIYKNGVWIQDSSSSNEELDGYIDPSFESIEERNSSKLGVWLLQKDKERKDIIKKERFRYNGGFPTPRADKERARARGQYTGPSLQEEARRRSAKQDKDVYRYNAQLGKGFFIEPYRGFYKHNDPYQNNPYVTFDIETADNGDVISVAAVKTIWDPNKQKLVKVDQFQRFYPTNDNNLIKTYPVHGLTNQGLNDLRKQQKASYAISFNKEQKQQFLDFIGNSTIVGHNALDFDIPKTLGFQLTNQVIDTYVVAQNLWGKSKKFKVNGKVIEWKNDLDTMFQRVTGVTMEQAGLSHHDAGSDAVANTIILKYLLKDDGPAGNELRALIKNRGLKYGPKESLPYANGERQSSLFFDVSPYGYETKGVSAYYDAQSILDQIGLSVSGTKKSGVNLSLLAQTEEDKLLMSTSIENTLDIQQRMLGDLSTLSDAIHTMAYQLGMNKRLPAMRAMVKSVDDDAMEKIARGFGYNDPNTIAALMQGAKALRAGNSWDSGYSLLKKMMIEGFGDSEEALKLRGVLSKDDKWGGTQIEELERLKRYRDLKEYTNLSSKMYRAGLSPEQEDYIHQMHDNGTSYEDLVKEIDKMQKNAKVSGMMEDAGLTSSQKDYINQLREEGASYEDLTRKIKELVGANQGVANFVTALANIKPYDIMQYRRSAGEQWSGIKGAAQGVIPRSLLTPLTRVGDAAFNNVDGKLVPYNRFMSVWNSGVGTAVTTGIGALGGMAAGAATGAAATSFLGPGALIGAAFGATIGLGSQIYGNYKQGKMERAALGIQESLNVTGAIISYISVPFKMLAKVTKTLIGSFSGLSFKLNNIMTTGLDALSTMGNPLTNLTGGSYEDYQGSTLVDIAALMNKGSLNSAYEKIAGMSQGLLTMGSLNKEQVLAASMLGIFGNTYLAGADSQQTTDNAINYLIAKMNRSSDKERSQIMYQAGIIDPALAQILQSARVMGVTNIKQLKDPSYRGMNDYRIKEGKEEHDMRWVQYEWGVAKTGFNNIKMRVGATLWKSFGKELYTSIGDIGYAISNGNWKQAIDSFVDLWGKFKNKITGIWKAITDKFTEKDSETGLSKMDKIYTSIVHGLAKIGIAAIGIGQTIMSVWNKALGYIIERGQGLIAYLSTVRIKRTGNLIDGYGIEFTTINSRNAPNWDEAMGVKWQDLPRNGGPGPTHYTAKNEKYIGIYKLIDQNSSIPESYKTKSLDDLTDQLWMEEGSKRRGALTYNFKGGANTFPFQTKQELHDILGLIATSREDMTAMEWAGAVAGSGVKYSKYTHPSIYNATGIADTWKTGVGSGGDVLSPILDSFLGSLKGVLGESYKWDEFTNALKSALDINIKVNDETKSSGTLEKMSSLEINNARINSLGSLVPMYLNVAGNSAH